MMVIGVPSYERNFLWPFANHKGRQYCELVRNVTQDLIEQGATTFYLGGYGEFDSLAASILREQKKKYPQIELVLVLAYLNTGRDVSGYDSTVYPPLENVPRRFSFLIEIAGW